MKKWGILQKNWVYRISVGAKDLSTAGIWLKMAESFDRNLVIHTNTVVHKFTGFHTPLFIGSDNLR